MKCYKVLCQSALQTLCSVSGYTPTEILYAPHRVIKPRIKHSKLFVFDTLDHAQTAGYGSQIWECEVKNPNKIKNIVDIKHNNNSPFSIVFYTILFWRRKKLKKSMRDISLMQAPEGTIVCDSVKLTKFVKMV
jgi:hypothetical protein